MRVGCQGETFRGYNFLWNDPRVIWMLGEARLCLSWIAIPFAVRMDYPFPKPPSVCMVGLSLAFIRANARASYPGLYS